MKLGAGAKSAESYFTGFLPIDVLLGWRPSVVGSIPGLQFWVCLGL